MKLACAQKRCADGDIAPLKHQMFEQKPIFLEPRRDTQYGPNVLAMHFRITALLNSRAKHCNVKFNQYFYFYMQCNSYSKNSRPEFCTAHMQIYINAVAILFLSLSSKYKSNLTQNYHLCIRHLNFLFLSFELKQINIFFFSLVNLLQTLAVFHICGIVQLPWVRHSSLVP